MARGRKTGGRDIPKGTTINPGGVSKEKRDFLTRMRDAEGDADRIYAAFMRLVKKGNAPAVLRAMEYIVGKPKEHVELTGKDGSPLLALIARLPRLSSTDMETLDDIFRRAEAAETSHQPGKDAPKPP